MLGLDVERLERPNDRLKSVELQGRVSGRSGFVGGGGAVLHFAILAQGGRRGRRCDLVLSEAHGGSRATPPSTEHAAARRPVSTKTAIGR